MQGDVLFRASLFFLDQQWLTFVRHDCYFFFHTSWQFCGCVTSTSLLPISVTRPSCYSCIVSVKWRHHLIYVEVWLRNARSVYGAGRPALCGTPASGWFDVENSLPNFTLNSILLGVMVSSEWFFLYTHLVHLEYQFLPNSLEGLGNF